MTRLRITALLLALIMILPAAFAEEDEDFSIEEIVEEVLLEDPEDLQEEETAPADPATEDDPYTPSYGSLWDHDLGSSYWTTPMDITNEQRIWDMLMEPITVVDLGKVKKYSHSQLTKLNTYMYQEPDKSSKIVGEITNLSQGLRVIEHLDNGWSHVECYSSSFFSKPATKIKAWNILVSGYVETKYLKQVKPTEKLALVVDKLAQHLYVFSEGKMVADLLCSTGLVQWNGSKYQPYNETRSGEVLLINMTGALNSDKLKCSYAIRFNAGDEIHEVPHQVDPRSKIKKYNTTEPYLGQKKSHGCIRVQRLQNPNGINMEWIYNTVRKNDLCGKVKIVVWEDWQGRQLPVPDPDTPVYYNPDKGQYYHSQDHCKCTKDNITFTAFSYSQLDEGEFAKLEPCAWCNPPRREADIAAINAEYALGGDHEELLNSLRKDYYAYLSE